MILYVLYGMDPIAKILGGCWIAIGIVYYLARAGSGRSSRRPWTPVGNTYGVAALRVQHIIG